MQKKIYSYKLNIKISLLINLTDIPKNYDVKIQQNIFKLLNGY